MPTTAIAYPTEQHRRAAEAIAEYFSGVPDVDALLQVGSCGRGRAHSSSCLDIVVLVRPEVLTSERGRLERDWEQYHRSQSVFREGEHLARYAFAEVEFVDGVFVPGEHHYTSGPDGFELEIGNYLAYSRTLLERSGYLRCLKQQWLPYYDELLRARRLAAVRRFGLNNLDHVGYFTGRGLYFQAFHRLYDAEREFLQALFISRRTYPIAYDKWIHEQLVEILKLPQVYDELVTLFQIGRLESDEMDGKATRLRRLYDEFVAEPGAVADPAG